MLQQKSFRVKIEWLKVFIIKYYDISKTYSVQFHFYCSVNLSHPYGFQSSILPQQSGAEEYDLYMNTEWNVFTEIVRGVFQEQFQRCCHLPSSGQHPDFVQFPKLGKSRKFNKPNFEKFPIGSNIGMLYIILTVYLSRLIILRTLKFFSHFGKVI